MTPNNKIRRRNFFGYLLGGLAAGFFAANPSSLFARGMRFFRPGKKIAVKQNPLAVPRKNNLPPKR